MEFNQMKILLVAVNSKYIHSNLAIYSLKAYAEKALKETSNAAEIPEIEIAEYTTNQPLQKILMDIYKNQPDVLFLSCYIWNRPEIEHLAADMSKIRPELDIWIGGPEVSYDAQAVMKRLPNIRGIISGEGEDKFYQIVNAYADKPEFIEAQLKHISGITFRPSDGKIITLDDDKRLELDSVPFPYDSLEDFQNRIIYYESSRGCPFRCSYCLSSIEKSLKFRSFDKVKAELGFFLERKVPQVKFIDRTFNCDHRHAQQIWKFLKENDNGITNFHFEIAADLITDEEIELLGSLRPGQVQLEIGVQSTNEKTLEEIKRPMDFERLSQVVSQIKKNNNIHLHLDLIAGLPFEDMISFEKSFNDVFSLRPEQLQLGFLKVLKGTMMDRNSEVYELEHTAAPPYEVLGTKWISYDDLVKLKMIEEMVEVYYNSGQFLNTVELLLESFDSPFRFFEALAQWYETNKLDMINLSRNHRYENLLEFGKEYADETVLLDRLIYDYYSRENVKSRPPFFGEDTVEKSTAKEFYNRESENHQYLKSPDCRAADVRLLRRLTHLEKLGNKYYLFDYTQRDPMTNNAKVTELQLDR